MRTELLRLNESAVRESVTRDARREAKKIFDARARTGLATGCTTVEHRNRQSLGCRVDGCRKSSGTRADDRHIVDMGRVEVGNQSKTRRKLPLVRIAQHRAVWTDNERKVIALTCESFE